MSGAAFQDPGPAGLRLAGQVWRLPPGIAATAPAVVRALPVRGGGGLAMLGGRAVPVLAPGRAAAAGRPAWAVVPFAGGEALVGGDELLASVPADAPALPMPDWVPARGGALAPVAALVAPSAPAVAARGAGVMGALELISPGGHLRLDLAMLVRVVPLPGWRPVPGAPAEVLGWAVAEGRPVLVLDPGGMADGARHLVLLTLQDRLVGVPCARMAPAQGASAEAADGAALLAPLLRWAVSAGAAAATAEGASRALLLVLAGGLRFALPATEVEAALAPLHPAALPGGVSVVLHRGDVLPVLDSGRLLGAAPVLAGGLVTCLRLQLPHPLALAVSGIEALRVVPETAIAPLDAPGLATAVLTLGGEAVPVCAAARLAESWARW